MEQHVNTETRNPVRVLRIDASARQQDSATRALGDELIAHLRNHYGTVDLHTRDVAQGLEFVDETWVGANYTQEADRSAAQRARLALSDRLVDELVRAEVLVIAVPVYNFGIPAALKAWVDLVARAQRTFRYTDNGPVGLLGGRKAYLAFASGGVAADSEADFAARYMRHVLGFLGITDVELIAAEGVAVDHAAAFERARARIAAIQPPRAAAA